MPAASVSLPVLPSDRPMRLTPTDVTQFVRFEQCERFLRFRLAERAGQKFMTEYDVNPQRITPLLSLSGHDFEEGIEESLGKRFAKNQLRGKIGGTRPAQQQELPPAQFEIDGVRYSQPALDGDDFDMSFEDETDILLSKLLPKSSRKARWIYEYDFGDGWRHEILFEGFPPFDPKAKAPLCLEGERACPPEDCGGPWGYGDYLAAIADPENEQHVELLEWRGPFDPEAFDAKQATKAMRKVT